MDHFRLQLDTKSKGVLGEWEVRRAPFDSVVFVTHSGSISLDAIRWLSRADIPVYILDWTGRLQSALLRTPPGSLPTRIQYPSLFISIACSLVILIVFTFKLYKVRKQI